MNISSITPPQVWTASSRSLTNFGSGALTSSSIVQTTLAASASVDLRTSAGIVGQTTVAVVTGAAATAAISVRLSDGTNAQAVVVTAAAANSFTGFHFSNTSSVGPQIANLDGVNAGKYMTSSVVMTI